MLESRKGIRKVKLLYIIYIILAIDIDSLLLNPLSKYYAMSTYTLSS